MTNKEINKLLTKCDELLNEIDNSVSLVGRPLLEASKVESALAKFKLSLLMEQVQNQTETIKNLEHKNER